MRPSTGRSIGAHVKPDRFLSKLDTLQDLETARPSRIYSKQQVHRHADPRTSTMSSAWSVDSGGMWPASRPASASDVSFVECAKAAATAWFAVVRLQTTRGDRRRARDADDERRFRTSRRRRRGRVDGGESRRRSIPGLRRSCRPDLGSASSLFRSRRRAGSRHHRSVPCRRRRRPRLLGSRR